MFALVRAAEIIGEAASKVSDETRRTMPSVPWQQIVSMRNRLIHAYFVIERDIVWKTVPRKFQPCSADPARSARTGVMSAPMMTTILGRAGRRPEQPTTTD